MFLLNVDTLYYNALECQGICVDNIVVRYIYWLNKLFSGAITL